MSAAYQPLANCGDTAKQPKGGEFKAFKDEYYRQLGKHYDPEAASEGRCSDLFALALLVLATSSFLRPQHGDGLTSSLKWLSLLAPALLTTAPTKCCKPGFKPLQVGALCWAPVWNTIVQSLTAPFVGNPWSNQENAIARQYLRVVQLRNDLFHNMFHASLLGASL